MGHTKTVLSLRKSWETMLDRFFDFFFPVRIIAMRPISLAATTTPGPSIDLYPEPYLSVRGQQMDEGIRCTFRVIPDGALAIAPPENGRTNSGGAFGSVQPTL